MTDIQKYTGKKIAGIQIAMMSDRYLEYEEGRSWLSDTGVGFKLDDGSCFSIFYDENNDAFGLYERTLEDHLTGVDHYFLELDENENIKELSNYPIFGIELIEKDIQTLDYNGEVVESIRVPVEYLIKLEEGVNIQVASVSIQLDTESATIAKIYHNPEGNIWISLGGIIEIE